MSAAENSRSIYIKTCIKISTIARYSNYTVIRAFRAEHDISYRRIIAMLSTGREYHNRSKSHRLASLFEIGKLEAVDPAALIARIFVQMLREFTLYVILNRIVRNEIRILQIQFKKWKLNNCFTY